MKRTLMLASLLLAASTSLVAQTPPPGSQPDTQGRAPHRMLKPCSTEADPAACEAKRNEMREKMQTAHRQAEEVCKGAAGADRRACMEQQMCAQAPDPARCEARAKGRAQHRHEMHRQHGAAPGEKS